MLDELPARPSATEPAARHDRVAAIEIAHSALLQLPGVSFDVMDTQGRLRDTGVFARLKEAMLLPESYTILLVMMRTYRIWIIGVESPDLPAVPDGEEPPQITPYYVREGDEARLTKLLLRVGGHEVDLLAQKTEECS